MPQPLPKGINITVEHKTYPSEFTMPSMEMATDHYGLGFAVSGDRKTITPTDTTMQHGGEVGAMPPYIYHRTMPVSAEKYERILIKFRPEFAEPFLEAVGGNVFRDLFEARIIRFHEEGRKKILRMFLDMAEEYEKQKVYSEFILQGMLFRLLTGIYEERLPEQEVERSKTPLTQPIMDAISYMELLYCESPSLEEMARKVNLSAAYFSRLFQAQMGVPYSVYLNRVKIRYARILLLQTKESVMEIAQKTGFCHGNYFSGQFKKEMGMTPSEYRKRGEI